MYFKSWDNVTNIFVSVAVRLVKVRAEAMQLASEMVPSGMMTVFFGPNSRLKTACADARKHCETLGLEIVECKVANFLYPDCKVIAGNKEVTIYHSFSCSRILSLYVFLIIRLWLSSKSMLLITN